MRYKSFEIRPTLGGSHSFELVKWTVVFGGTEGCFVIAFIDWDPSEKGWSIECVGTRVFESYEDGLSEYVLKYLDLLDFCLHPDE